MKNIPKIIITPGEPSGIGYDIVLDISKENFQASIIVVANIDLLKDRAHLLNKKINIVEVSIFDKNLAKEVNNTIFVHNISENNKVVIGKPDIKHAPLVLKSLDTAIDACLDNFADAMVTGPVQKSTIMEYGEEFPGHTEYIASKTGGQPIMMLHTVDTRIALLTTHVSLSKVPSLVTKERIETNVEIITNDLIEKFGINNPKISVCGLNPHAGENGYIGTEEKNIIIPAIKSLKNKGFNVEGPFSADTIFTRK